MNAVLEPATAGISHKVLAFRVSREHYAVDIRQVREILEPPEVTFLPGAHPSVRGVINLRGRVMPLWDLKHRLGQSASQLAEASVIMVLQYGDGPFAVLVDEVLDVVDMKSDQIEPAPTTEGGGEANRFLRGVGRHDARLIFLLDLSEGLGATA